MFPVFCKVHRLKIRFLGTFPKFGMWDYSHLIKKMLKENFSFHVVVSATNNMQEKVNWRQIFSRNLRHSHALSRYKKETRNYSKQINYKNLSSNPLPFCQFVLTAFITNSLSSNKISCNSLGFLSLQYKYSIFVVEIVTILSAHWVLGAKSK